MFLARILGTITATSKHRSLEHVRFLVGRRLEGNGSESGEPMVIVDNLGASHGSVVLVSTDGSAIRERYGNNAPVRLSVMGLVPSANEGLT